LAAAIIPALTPTLLVGLVFGEWWRLTSYFWYFFPGVPLQDPAVVYSASFYSPLAVVAIFGLAIVSASLIHYCTLKRVLDLGKFAPLKQTAFFQAAVRCFKWQPWWTIAVIAFTPLPFFPVRVLALGSDYPVLRYVSACLAGRLPCFYLLAMGGVWVNIPFTDVMLMALAVSLVPCAGMVWLRRSTAPKMGSAA
jgi:hypothetical protein